MKGGKKLLEINNLHWKGIIKGVTLKTNGGLTVITGPNGGGKTSLAKLIAGVEQPDEGEMILDGENITPLSVTERAKNGVAYAFQQPVRFKGLTVRDLLELAAGEKLKYNAMCDLLGKVGLCAEEYISREMNNSLSGGEAKRIEIATVLARRARLSVFDEPEAGIDLWSFSRLVETFEEIRKNNSGELIVISHQERILKIADNIAVVADGKIRVSGRREEILPQLMRGEYTCDCPRRN